MEFIFSDRLAGIMVSPGLAVSMYLGTGQAQPKAGSRRSAGPGSTSTLSLTHIAVLFWAECLGPCGVAGAVVGSGWHDQG